MSYSGFTKSAVRLLSQVYRGLGSHGDRYAMWLEQGRYDLIIKAEMPHPDTADFPRAYACWNLLRKSSTPDIGLDTEAAAIKTWRANELECLRTNYSHGVRPDMISPQEKPVAEAVIFTAIRKITDCLGPFSYDELFRFAEYSGGASTQRKRKVSQIQNKYVDNPYITPAAVKYWYMFHSLTHLDLGWPVFTQYSRFHTVPKDAKTDRPIIIEPQGNMFFQKALGQMIRMRLKRKGINLNDQTRNQDLAGRGVSHRLATIDLSSASDLISVQTVALLLQGAPEWFNVLWDLRVDTTIVEGEFVRLQKFSGMGNGFTFELESLIFWALAEASAEVEKTQGGCTCETVISIYGDDIIINSHHVDTLVCALHYCGFKVNRTKSYWSGPFRESCGKHYYNGADISPITVKDEEFKRLEDLYWLYNSVNELYQRLDIPTRDVLKPIETLIRQRQGWYYVPPRFSNKSGIRAPLDVACPKVKRKPRNRKTPWFGGWSVKYYTPVVKSQKVSQTGAYYYALRRNYYSDSDALFDSPDVTVVQQAQTAYHFQETEVALWD